MNYGDKKSIERLRAEREDVRLQAVYLLNTIDTDGHRLPDNDEQRKLDKFEENIKQLIYRWEAKK